MQLYALSTRYLRPRRVFAQVSPRGYYDDVEGNTLPKSDLQLGDDYYDDNLRRAPLEAVCVHQHRDRFWDNVLRAGSGVRWCPQRRQAGRFSVDLRARLHVVAEGVTTWRDSERIRRAR